MMRIGIDEDGVFQEEPPKDAPEPERLQAAKQWLRRPSFLSTPRFRALGWKARREGARMELLEWIDQFRSSMAEVGIPVYAEKIVVTDAEQVVAWVKGRTNERHTPYIDGRACDIVHAIRGRELPDIAWQVFRMEGERMAERLGLDIVWGGPDRPWMWYLPPETPDQIENDRQWEEAGGMPKNPSKSPPGEREMLERHYGLRPPEE